MQAPSNRWLLSLTALLCTVVLALGVLHVSLERGRLAFTPAYDDVIYLARGAQLTRAGHNGWAHAGVGGAVRALARDWKKHPPHSPWASGAAALGYACSGYQDWAAYVPTALPVAAFLLCAARMARGAGGRWNWRGHALVVFASTAPFLAASVYNLKPDYAAGICAAIAMSKALRAPLLASGKAWRRHAWTGVWFGLALLAKPAMMVPTAMLAGGTLAICTVRDLALRWRSGPRGVPLLRIAGAWTLVLGAMVLVALPHFALAWRHEWNYTRGTLAGEGAERWGYRGSWAEHAVYYLTGPGGRLMLDGVRSLAPLALAIAAYGGVVLSPRPRSGRRLAYLIATLATLGMAWLGPTLATVKISQFASCFTALAWLVGVRAAAGVCRAARPGRVPWRRPAVASALVLALLGPRLAAYRWTFPLGPAPGDPARTERDARSDLARRTYETVKAEAAHGARSILAAGGQADLGIAVLSLWIARDGLQLQAHQSDAAPATGDGLEDARMGRRAFDRMDLNLVSQGGSPARKSKAERADLFYLDLARTDPGLELVGRTTDPRTGAFFELYRRRTDRPTPPP